MKVFDWQCFRDLFHKKLRLRSRLEITFGIGFAIVLALITGVVSSHFFDASLEVAAFAGILILLVVLWTTEALPLGVTSLLPILLFPAFGILDVKDATSNYANPIIFLFLGGFMLAAAIEKIGLHRVIARELLSRFPKTPRGVIAALGVASIALGSALSNSTVALLLIPVALSITQEPTLRTRFLLAVAFGASISGITTPIGTPPNLIFLGFLETVGFHSISFVMWVCLMLPLTISMLVVMVFVLSYGCKDHVLEVDNFACVPITFDHKRLLALVGFLVLILLLNSPIKPYYNGLGLNENVVLLAFGLLMFVPKIGFLEWQDSKVIPYEINFLFGAGFCIAMAISEINVGDSFAYIINYVATLPLWLFLLLVSLLSVCATMFISSTALIAIFLPVLFGATKGFLEEPVQVLVMLIATVSVGFSFMFPISTPPNAIVFSKGGIKIREMFCFGIILSLAGIMLLLFCALVYWRLFA